MSNKPTVTERKRVIHGVTYKDWRISLGSVKVDGKPRRVQCFKTGTEGEAKIEGAKLGLLGELAPLLTWDQIKDMIKCFKDLSYEEVKAECAKMYLMYKRQGKSAMLLTQDQVMDYVTAKAILNDAGYPMSLTKSTQDYVRMMSGVGVQGGTIDDIVTFKTLAQRYQASLDESLSVPYRRSIAYYIGAFEERINRDTPCGKLSTEAVKKVLEDIANGNAWSYKNARGTILTLFNWGTEEGIISKNPLLKVGRKRPIIEEPSFLKSAAVSEILAEGQVSYNAGLYMPWLILGFFCGIRSAEISRMTWENILWEDGEVKVKTPKGYTSGTRPRHVTLNPAARAWLSLYKKESGPMGACQARFGIWRRSLKSYQRIIEATKKDAGNVMRHTFATMHYAMHKNLALTAAEMGHYGNVNTTLKHYMGLNSQRDAEVFWALRPTA